MVEHWHKLPKETVYQHRPKGQRLATKDWTTHAAKASYKQGSLKYQSMPANQESPETNQNMNQGLQPRKVCNSWKPGLGETWWYIWISHFNKQQLMLHQVTYNYSYANISQCSPNSVHISFLIRWSYPHCKKLNKNHFSIFPLSLQIFSWQKSWVNFTARSLKGNRT